MAHYYGVRHLSPACAYYVSEFLKRCSPGLVLIEGPSDLNELIKPLCSHQALLPAAILAYTEKAPVRTVMWPFAEFSPEYQAMKWAIRNDCEVRFLDLPAYSQLAVDDEESEDDEKTDKSQPVSVYEKLETLCGYDDDSFWEHTFEHCGDYDDFLAAVREYGRNIRSSSRVDEHTALREAYMRKIIAQAEETVPSDRIAVITGAFHTDGIKDTGFTDEDRKLTDKIPDIKIKATLMPYSYFRLSSRSGYGAGSKAPAYFELVWKNFLSKTPQNSSVEYLSKIAAFQREHGYSASTAQVIEAKRLASVLAGMRGSAVPGLDDLRDAAVTCIGHGSLGEISVACADTEIGSKIGSLPEGTVCTSVQEDFLRQLSELKLEKYRKLQAEETELDLRENLRVKSEKSAFLGLHRSFFLHRLRILNVHFGKSIPRAQENATWAEAWRLQWTPECEIEIVEASLNGDTIINAAENVLNLRLANAQSVAESSQILSDVFLCGLSDCVASAVNSVQRLAVDCSSASETGKAVGFLSSVIRYGSIRRIDSEPVRPLTQKLFLRFCLCAHNDAVCDKNAAEEMISAIAVINDACLSHDFLDENRFITLLSELSYDEFVNPLIGGFACAVLSERGKISNDDLSAVISRKLSKGSAPADGALWFEGFARKNRRSLISRLSVWEKLCSFISELDDNDFKPVLLSLRRTFCNFTPGEKSDIAENIGEVLGLSKEAAAEFVMNDLSEEEKQNIDELDDFDFGDI